MQPAAPLSFSEGAGCGVLCSWVVAGRAARPPCHGRRWDAAAQPRRHPRGPARPRPARPGGLGLGRPGLRAGHRLVPLLPRRGRLLLRGPRLLLGGGLRLPRLGQPRLGLPRGQARLPRISLGLLGAGLKPGPGLLGRRDLRLEPGPLPGLVPLGVLAGLRHLLLRGPAHPVQLRPGRLGRLPRLGQPRLSLPGLAGPGSPCLLGPRLLLGGGLRLPRLGQPRLGLLGAGLKPGPGLLGRRDLRLEPGPQPGLVPLGVLAGLRHLLLRGPAHPVQLRPGRLGRLPRPRRVLPGLAGPDSASAARDSARPPGTRRAGLRRPSSRSCRAAATCSCAARASCSAAAFASRASAPRASAPQHAPRPARRSRA